MALKPGLAACHNRWWKKLNFIVTLKQKKKNTKRWRKYAPKQSPLSAIFPIKDSIGKTTGRTESWGNRLFGSHSIHFCISKAQFGHFPSFRNSVWAALFFTCNHCNIISFLTQSNSVLDARLVPPTQSSAKVSRPALLEHSSLGNCPCFPILQPLLSQLKHHTPAS